MASLSSSAESELAAMHGEIRAAGRLDLLLVDEYPGTLVSLESTFTSN